MKLVFSIAAGIILAIVLLAVGCSALVAGSVDDANVAAVSSAVADDAPDASEGTSGEEGTSETAGQENARRAAESYLDTMAFSRQGLIEQLSSDAGSGFSRADATYAVDAVSPDWNEQAAKAAQSYLDTMRVFPSAPDRAIVVGRRLGLHPRAGRVWREPDRSLVGRCECPPSSGGLLGATGP